jgi:hypothetical protein
MLNEEKKALVPLLLDHLISWINYILKYSIDIAKYINAETGIEDKKQRVQISNYC